MSATTRFPALRPGDTLDVVVQMLSDWHIGTGTGRDGTVDRVVLRDDSGVVHLPASSLWGVWRDSTEQLAVALDGGQAGAWCQLVDTIFGSQPARATDTDTPPTPAAITLDTAILPAATREVVGHPALVRSLTTIRPGVAIDPDTGTARPDQLRMIEVARGDVELRSTVTVVEPLDAAAHALLVAGARQIRAVGGKRRRGLGRCRVVVSSPGGEAFDAAALVAELRDAYPATEAPLPAAESPLEHPEPTERLGSRGWRRAEITIDAVTPVLVADRVVGNTTRSSGRVPGATLLSIVQRTATRPLYPLLADGRLRIGDALPVDEQRGLLLPAPRSIAVSKGDHAGQLRSLFDDDPGPVRRLDPRAGVAHVPGAGLAVRTPRTRLRIHNVVDDARQRPTSDTGGLFSREVHDPGTRWRSTIWYHDSIADEVVQVLSSLPRSARIGRAKKDDYGKVELHVSLDEPEAPTLDGTAERATILLTSDAVLLDDALRFDPTPAGLARTIALALERPPDSITVEERGAHATTRRIESWHAGWGLPRPSLVGLAAGSVVVLVASEDQPLSLGALEEIGRLGVGERTAEGHGRFVVEPSELAADSFADEPDPSDLIHIPIPDLPDDPFARRVGEDALLAAVRRLAEGGWDAGTGLGSAQLTNSQLGALRAACLGANWQATAESWLDGVEKTPRRADTWPARIQRRLRELVDTPRSLFDGVLADWPDSWKDHVADRAVPLALGEIVRLRQHTGEDTRGDR